MKRENPEDQDSAWQRIVDNYGERVELESADVSPVEAGPDHEPADEPADEPEGHHELSSLFDDNVEGFVPESPPPIPVPPPDRLLAWLGVFGSPTVLLVFLVLGLDLPSLVSWILIGGFVFGFCYLVFRMPRTPRDPWDDGAVV